MSVPTGDKLAAWSAGSWISQAVMSPDGSLLFQPNSQGLGEFRGLPQGKLLGQPLRLGSDSQFAFTGAFSLQSDLCALADREKLALYDPKRAFCGAQPALQRAFSCALLD